MLCQNNAVGRFSQEIGDCGCLESRNEAQTSVMEGSSRSERSHESGVHLPWAQGPATIIRLANHVT